MFEDDIEDRKSMKVGNALEAVQLVKRGVISLKRSFTLNVGHIQ